MGRGTEIIEFINVKKIPDELHMMHRYNYINKTDELKKFRKEYRKNFKIVATKTKKEFDNVIK